MTLDTAIQASLTFLASLGGLTVVLLGLITFLSRIWEGFIFRRLETRQETVLEKIRNQYAVEIERLRADLDKQNAALGNTNSAISSGYMASHPHIVEAIKELWTNIVALDALTSRYLFPHSILLRKEIPTLSKEQISQSVYADTSQFDAEVYNIEQAIKLQRPFLGERLWVYYSTYRNFILRLCWKMQQTYKGKGLIYPWDLDAEGQQDHSMLRMLEFVLTKEELEVILSEEMAVPDRVLTTLKSKMLEEMNELVFGKRLVALSIEEQSKTALSTLPLGQIRQVESTGKTLSNSPR